MFQHGAPTGEVSGATCMTQRIGDSARRTLVVSAIEYWAVRLPSSGGLRRGEGEAEEQKMRDSDVKRWVAAKDDR